MNLDVGELFYGFFQEFKHSESEFRLFHELDPYLMRNAAILQQTLYPSIISVDPLDDPFKKIDNFFILRGFFA